MSLQLGRFVSELEPAITLVEDSLIGSSNVSGIMTKIEDIARPLVGLRTKSNEFWWSYPMLVLYLAIDTTLDGRKGNCKLLATSLKSIKYLPTQILFIGGNVCYHLHNHCEGSFK